MRALAHNEDFNIESDQPTEVFIASLKHFDKDDVPALFFTCNSWLAMLGLKPSGSSVFTDLHRIEAMLDRILELNETFNYGSAHALLGSYLASMPPTFGGRPEQAKFHFKEAMGIAEHQYLLWDFLYARFYAVQVQDKELFLATLNKIIKTPVDYAPANAFITRLAQEKAKRLIKHVDALF